MFFNVEKDGKAWMHVTGYLRIFRKHYHCVLKSKAVYFSCTKCHEKVVKVVFDGSFINPFVVVHWCTQ